MREASHSQLTGVHYNPGDASGGSVGDDAGPRQDKAMPEHDFDRFGRERVPKDHPSTKQSANSPAERGSGPVDGPLTPATVIALQRLHGNTAVNKTPEPATDSRHAQEDVRGRRHGQEVGPRDPDAPELREGTDGRGAVIPRHQSAQLSRRRGCPARHQRIERRPQGDSQDARGQGRQAAGGGTSLRKARGQGWKDHARQERRYLRVSDGHHIHSRSCRVRRR